MASFTIGVAPWDAGTLVSVYRGEAWVDPARTPSGQALSTGTVTSLGSVSFDGLEERRSCVAYAAGRGVRFLVPSASQSSSRPDRERIALLEEVDADIASAEIGLTDDELLVEALDADRRVVGAINVTFYGAPGDGSLFLWSDGGLGTWRPTKVTTLNFVDYIDGFTVTYRPHVLTPNDRSSWGATAGFLPLTDAEASALVTRVPEVRLENVARNAYVPSDAELQAFHAELLVANDPQNPYLAYVTGRPGITDPTTDELIQWCSHKWKLPTNVVRAQMHQESRWSMDFLGDATTQPDQAHYDAAPEYARVPSSLVVYESLGISQLRWFPDKVGNLNPHPGTDPLRWKSTAFNLDVYGATVRAYFDDPGGWRTDWGDVTYEPGDEWLSVGGWFLPYPWDNEGQNGYVAAVQARLDSVPWTVADFSNVEGSIALVVQPDITRTGFGPIIERPRPVMGTYVPPTVPDAPTGLEITPGNNVLTLTWTAPADDGGAPLTSYRFTEVNELWTVDTGGVNDVIPYTLSGLTNGHEQTFTVAAANSVGYSEESGEASGTPQAPTAPGAPTGVSGTPGNALVHLSWTAPASNGGSPITAYRITPYIGASAQSAINTGSTATTRNVTGLANDTAYTFKVAAINVAGTSADSTASGSVTPAVPDTALPRPAERIIVSRSKTAAASGDGGYPASNGVDNTTGTTVRSFPVLASSGTPARFAVDLEDEATAAMSILLKNNTRPSWNKAGALGDNGVGNSKVCDFTIQTHSSIVDGIPAIDDAGWTTVQTVTSNRWSDVYLKDDDDAGFDFTGVRYVQIRATESTGSGDNRDVAYTSVEIADISNTDGDSPEGSFRYVGDSHGQESWIGFNYFDGQQFPSGTGPIDKVVETAIGEHVPALITDNQGGYGIVPTPGLYDEYTTKLADLNASFLIIMFWPNDSNAWNIDVNTLTPAGVSSTPATTWKTRMQAVIDFVVAQGVKVILGKSPACHNNTWTRANLLVIHEMVDDLIEENPGDVFLGPDFFDLFDDHPELFRDNGGGDTDLHPTGDVDSPIYDAGTPWESGDPRGRWDDGTGPLTGYQWMLRLWAEWFASVYS